MCSHIAGEGARESRIAHFTLTYTHTDTFVRSHTLILVLVPSLADTFRLSLRTRRYWQSDSCIPLSLFAHSFFLFCSFLARLLLLRQWKWDYLSNWAKCVWFLKTKEKEMPTVRLTNQLLFFFIPQFSDLIFFFFLNKTFFRCIFSGFSYCSLAS